VISDAPMSTEFAISRFLVPHLAHDGWALFLDADMLALGDLAQLFDAADERFAIMCVKHDYAPTATMKMDGQQQTLYARKNWSSLMLFNCDHPANAALTVEMINTLPGRDLHRFCWLDDSLIGALDPKWNWLVGHSSPEIEPAIVHFTEGGPWFPGFENVPYANAWRTELQNLTRS
jgi:lipopolysaccharide biosynthesis glycosyltransferase